MKTTTQRTLISSLLLVVLGAAATLALAKLPPLSDEAKAKAAEAAAKTAHGNKVADFQLCKSQQQVADAYRAEAKKAGKTLPAPTETPACADPGPFVYTPPAPAGAAPAAATAATAAAPKK
jgi:type II secretory pathway pseudopilin PulG